MVLLSWVVLAILIGFPVWLEILIGLAVVAGIFWSCWDACFDKSKFEKSKWEQN